MPAAAILAQGSFSGVSGTLTLTAAVPGDGTLHVCWASATISAADWDNVINDTLTDSNAIPWFTFSSFLPLIGELAVDNSFIEPEPSPGDRDTLYIGSSARACTTGDLGIGDTVSIHMDSDFPGSFSFSAILVYIPAPFVAVDQVGWGSSTVYANSDYHFPPNLPDWATEVGFGSPFPDRITWWSDPFVSPPPQAQDNAYVIVMSAAYPAISGFSPYTGGVVGEELGVVSLAIHTFNTSADAYFDPGGIWPSDAFMLGGNYQTQERPLSESGYTVSQHFSPS